MEHLTSYKIIRLIFRSAPGYVVQSRRNMMLHINDKDLLQNTFAETTHNARNMTASNLAGFTPNVMRFSPSTNNNLFVPEGWGAPRFIFFMEIEIHTRHNISNMLVTGYTDHPGVTNGGMALDTNMRLHVTSSIEYSKTPTSVMVNKAQSVFNPVPLQGFNGQPSEYTVRPMDVMAGVWMVDDEKDLQAAQMFELGQNGKMSDITPSVVRNDSPIQWTARSLQQYSKAGGLTDGSPNTFGWDMDHDRHKTATSNLQEDTAHDMTFLGNSIQMRAEMLENGGTFTIATLDAITGRSGYNSLANAGVSNITEVITTPYTAEFMDSNNWQGSDHESIGASTIRSILPTMMQENMIQRLGLFIDNMTPIGIDNPNYGNGYRGKYNVIVNPGYPPAAFTPNVTLQFIYHQIEQILDRVALEICPLLGSSGQRFSAKVTVDLTEAIVVEISYNPSSIALNQYDRYVSPAFATAMLSPMIVNDNNQVIDMRDNFYLLTQLVDEVEQANNTGKQTQNFTSSSGYFN